MVEHYSVRRSEIDARLWKVVIAGRSWGRGYADTDTGYFSSFEEAARCAERLEGIRHGKDGVSPPRRGAFGPKIVVSNSPSDS